MENGKEKKNQKFWKTDFHIFTSYAVLYRCLAATHVPYVPVRRGVMIDYRGLVFHFYRSILSVKQKQAKAEKARRRVGTKKPGLPPQTQIRGCVS